MNQAFPKSSRLRFRREFEELSKSPNRKGGKYIFVEYKQTCAQKPKLGITASKKYGKAHDRNQFKRLVREAFRTSPKLQSKTLDIVVKPRGKGGSQNFSMQDIQKDLESLF